MYDMSVYGESSKPVTVVPAPAAPILPGCAGNQFDRALAQQASSKRAHGDWRTSWSERLVRMD